MWLVDFLVSWLPDGRTEQNSQSVMHGRVFHRMYMGDCCLLPRLRPSLPLSMSVQHLPRDRDYKNHLHLALKPV